MANERLTNDYPIGLMQNALNLFFAKDGEAWARNGGPSPAYLDIPLWSYIRDAIRNNLTDGNSIAELPDEDLGEILLDWLSDGNGSVEGLIGVLYTAAWAFAELRERLKQYEDTEIEVVNDAPTVDAVEVVHGRWDIEVGMNYNKERICPVCNKHIESNYWNYCPNCGAKMDGDGNA